MSHWGWEMGVRGPATQPAAPPVPARCVTLGLAAQTGRVVAWSRAAEIGGPESGGGLDGLLPSCVECRDGTRSRMAQLRRRPGRRFAHGGAAAWSKAGAVFVVEW